MGVRGDTQHRCVAVKGLWPLNSKTPNPNPQSIFVTKSCILNKDSKNNSTGTRRMTMMIRTVETVVTHYDWEATKKNEPP